MVPAEEFRRHAVECKNMAAFTHDPQSRATWNRMAERWLQCAEWAKQYSPPIQKMAKGKSHRHVAADLPY